MNAPRKGIVMRFFYLLFSIFSVALRLLVVAAPFVYWVYGTDIPELDFLSGFNMVYAAPIWSVVSFFLLFWPDLRAERRAVAAGRSGVVYASDADAEAYEDDRRSFDFLIPGTAAYYMYNCDTEIDLRENDS